MEVRPVKQTIEHFENLLNRKACIEGDFQSFLEQEPAFLLTPFLLNHHLHASAVISQFRLNTSLTADFAYLTKSSVQWRLVLVEIERPDIKLFLSSTEQVTPTAEFTKRLAQIHEWRDEVKRDLKMVIRSLEPLRRPFERNAIDVRFLLIIGRSSEHVLNQRHADRLLHLGGEDLQISSFDSLLRHYLSGHAQAKNVLVINKGIFSFKYLHLPPPNLFSLMYPHELSITDPQASRLRSWGYDIPAWKSGKLLAFGGKRILDNSQE